MNNNNERDIYNKEINHKDKDSKVRIPAANNRPASQKALPKKLPKTEVVNQQISKEYAPHRVKRIEDPWFQISFGKSVAKMEQKAKRRAQKLIITSELGVKPLSHSDLNTDGIACKATSSQIGMGSQAKKAVKMTFTPPERMNNLLHTKAFHQNFAPSLKDFTYYPPDFEASKDRYLYRKFKLPSMC